MRVAALLGVVRRRDHPEKRRLHGDVRIDLLARNELELVDYAFVARIGHGEKDAVSSHEHRQDAVCFCEIARHDIEMLEDEGDLSQVDPRHAMLLGKRAQHLDLVDRAVVDELGCEWRGRRGALLRAERGIQVLLRHELTLQQDLAERPFFVA
jgi:hypothetical protein